MAAPTPEWKRYVPLSRPQSTLIVFRSEPALTRSGSKVARQDEPAVDDKSSEDDTATRTASGGNIRAVAEKASTAGLAFGVLSWGAPTVLDGRASVDSADDSESVSVSQSESEQLDATIVTGTTASDDSDLVSPRGLAPARKGFVQRLRERKAAQNDEVRSVQQAIERLKRQREQVRGRLEQKIVELLREQCHLRQRLAKRKIAIAYASQTRDRLIAEVDELQQYSIENEELAARLSEIIEETCMFADRASELSASMPAAPLNNAATVKATDSIVPREIQLAALSRRRFENIADNDTGIVLKTKLGGSPTTNTSPRALHKLRGSIQTLSTPSLSFTLGTSSTGSPTPSLSSSSLNPLLQSSSSSTPSTQSIPTQSIPTQSIPTQSSPTQSPTQLSLTQSTASQSTTSTASQSTSSDTNSNEEGGDIVIDGLTFSSKIVDGQMQHVLRGGTVDALINHLFRPSTSLTFTATFLLTYHSFIEPGALLSKAIAAYTQLDAREEQLIASKTSGGGGDDDDGQSLLLVKKEKLRIASFLNSWLDTSFFDFENGPLLGQLQEFLNGTVAPKAELLALKLKRAIERRLNDTCRNFWSAPVNVEAKTPRGDAPLSVLDYSPGSIATQLTLRDYGIFSRIEPKELLGKSWAADEATKEKRSPNVFALTKRFNMLSNWVATTIVNETNLRKRTSVLEHMVRVAAKLDALNNFFGVMAVLAGLSQNSVYRLHRTWERLPRSLHAKVDSLRDMMSREANCKKYRLELHSRNPPLVPHLAIYLADLTFLEDGNPDLLPSGQINWIKRCRIAEVLREIHQYQQMPYSHAIVPDLVAFLADSPVLDPDKQFDQSLIAEPKVPRP